MPIYHELVCICALLEWRAFYFSQALIWTSVHLEEISDHLCLSGTLNTSVLNVINMQDSPIISLI
jgi:hypothetical protein